MGGKSVRLPTSKQKICLRNIVMHMLTISTLPCMDAVLHFWPLALTHPLSMYYVVTLCFHRKELLEQLIKTRVSHRYSTTIYYQTLFLTTA